MEHGSPDDCRVTFARVDLISEPVVEDDQLQTTLWLPTPSAWPPPPLPVTALPLWKRLKCCKTLQDQKHVLCARRPTTKRSLHRHMNSWWAGPLRCSLAVLIDMLQVAVVLLWSLGFLALSAALLLILRLRPCKSTCNQMTKLATHFASHAATELSPLRNTMV